MSYEVGPWETRECESCGSTYQASRSCAAKVSGFCSQCLAYEEGYQEGVNVQRSEQQSLVDLQKAWLDLPEEARKKVCDDLQWEWYRHSTNAAFLRESGRDEAGLASLAKAKKEAADILLLLSKEFA